MSHTRTHARTHARTHKTHTSLVRVLYNMTFITRIEIDEKRQIHITYMYTHVTSRADSCKLDFNRISWWKN